MKIYLIIITSLLLQFLAVYLALNLMRITGKITAWIFIAGAIIFMALRRGLLLYGTITGGVVLMPTDVAAEIIALVTSALMAIGLGLIAPLFLKVTRSEAALREISVYTRSLIEASLDPLVTIGKDGKIMDVNQATEKVTGVPRNRLKGKDFADFFTDPEKAREGYEQVFAQGMVKDYPLALRHVSGSFTYVLYNASVYKNEFGEVQGVFAVARDITARKQVEGALEQKILELGRSNAALEEFAYAASHDLQEPLRKIINFTELLMKRYKGHLEDKAEKYLWYVVDGAARMQRLINDLLSYSRLGKVEASLELTNIAEILKRTLDDLQPQIEKSGAEIDYDPLPTLKVNSTQIGQLLQNFILNAIKFNRNHPPHVHISAQQKDSEWVFSVKDNGIGIDQQYAERIFGLFQRLHTREEYPGTGAGLAICKKIVESSGGRIWVESEPGKGSTFYFTIPG